jgi:hypothetical protein
VPLSDKTVRNALGPLKACLATARREGLIRHNPATDVALPHRARVDDDDDRPRPFPRIEGDDGELIETMELVVERVHESHRLMFELLAATGLRRSELLVLEGRHLALDGERPHVKVSQRVRRRRGEGLVIGPLKSRYSKRDVPISRTLADRLRAIDTASNDFVFCTTTGTVLDPDNLAMSVLAPACKAPASSGQASIRFVTPSRRACLPGVGMSCRFSAGSATIRPALRSTPTLTCSITILASRLGRLHESGEYASSIAVRFFYGRFSPARKCRSRRGGRVDLALARR